VAEIGFNHLGDYNITNEYVNTLLNSDVDAITFQVREREHRQNKPYRYFDDKDFYFLFERIKDSNKKVGVALADKEYISFFEELGVDFYKVIRNDITNRDLLNELIGTGKKLYVSTGLSSEKDIEEFIVHIENDKNQFKLIHTQLSNDINDCNLKSIETMKKYGLEVGYGSHCKEKTTIFMSLCYEPSDIFIYVKGDAEAPYPDKDHAIKISEFAGLVDNINKYKKALGVGVKKNMDNKIERLKTK
jgi:sialic acid synthase SpsE